MKEEIEPCRTLQRAALAALAGDKGAADWLQVVAPDLAEDVDKLGRLVSQWHREDQAAAAMLMELEGPEYDKDLQLAGELDHYLEVIHEHSYDYRD